MTAQDILHFWFKELTDEKRFAKDPVLDQQMRDRFLQTHHKATRGELSSWRVTAEGRLAEIIILDQFSRNMFRDETEAFAYDALALILAQEMVLLKLDTEIEISMRAFVYLPYMHSESALIHAEAHKLFQQPGLENNFKYEILHKNIIDRFGRFPHRNQVLGRKSTPEEIEFLKQPGSSF